MMRLLFPCVALLAGCQSTDGRCRDVLLQSFSSRVYAESDSAERAALGPQAPPRPSDLAWYAEHCFEGKPR